MIDEELLKRVAEIEGFTKHPDQHTYWVDSHRWNPLTNGSDLLPLIEKYTKTNVIACISWEGDRYEIESYVGERVFTVFDKSLARTCLMAIIEAHK